MEVYNKINDQNSDWEYHHELLSSPLLISELSFKCIADPVRYSQGTCTDMVIQLIPHTIDYINRCFIRKSVEDNVATQKSVLAENSHLHGFRSDDHTFELQSR